MSTLPITLDANDTKLKSISLSFLKDVLEGWNSYNKEDTKLASQIVEKLPTEEQWNKIDFRNYRYKIYKIITYLRKKRNAIRKVKKAIEFSDLEHKMSMYMGNIILAYNAE